MKQAIRILIADDHTVVRAGLKAILEFEKDLSVVGEATNGLDAVRKSAELHPNVVIMDLMMPRLSGADATAKIKSADTNVQVLILTSYGSAEDINKALSAGASGVLLKNASDDQLVAAIRKVSQGGKAMPAEIAKTIKFNPPVAELTERQLEILLSVTRGLSNNDIAKQFDISPSGVKHHLTTIFAKLGAASRAEAVTIALRKHLLKI